MLCSIIFLLLRVSSAHSSLVPRNNEAGVKQQHSPGQHWYETSAFFHQVRQLFLAATTALEVQMLVCVCVCLSVCHTCYNCTKDLNFKVFGLWT